MKQRQHQICEECVENNDSRCWMRRNPPRRRKRRLLQWIHTTHQSNNQPKKNPKLHKTRRSPSPIQKRQFRYHHKLPRSRTPTKSTESTKRHEKSRIKSDYPRSNLAPIQLLNRSHFHARNFYGYSHTENFRVFQGCIKSSL